MQTQLDHASAVVLVTDFTQRKTQADAEIQKLVNDVTNLTDRLFDQLFIFVNKFDQRRADDWDEEETRQYLAKTLLNGTVKPEHIYPVSALKAFLANWAQRQLEECDQLPDPETSSLTKDFGKAAFGEMWEDDIGQPDRVQKGADRLWKRSLFAGPLDNVISVAARNASLVCLKGATAKLLGYSRTLDNFLNIRDGAMTKNVEELQEAIGNLQRDIEKINKKKETAEGSIKAKLGEFPEIVGAGCEDWSGQLRQVIEQYFKTDKGPPPQEGLKENLRKVLDRIGKWVPERFKKPLDISVRQTGPDFSPRQIRKFRGSNHTDKAKDQRDILLSHWEETQGRVVSPLIQAFLTIDELWWGDFGRYCRLAQDTQAVNALIELTCRKVAERLAPRLEHTAYYDFIAVETLLSSVAKMRDEQRELVCYLADRGTADRNPLFQAIARSAQGETDIVQTLPKLPRAFSPLSLSSRLLHESRRATAELTL